MLDPIDSKSSFIAFIQIMSGRRETFSRGVTKCPRSLIIDKLKRRSSTTSSVPTSTIRGSGPRGSTPPVRRQIFKLKDWISGIFLDGPSLVLVNVFVRSFSSIDDVKMVRFIFPKAPSQNTKIYYLNSGQNISILNLIDSSVVCFQEYSFQITLRQQWNDKRLRYHEKLPALGVQEGRRLICSLLLYVVSSKFLPE